MKIQALEYHMKKPAGKLCMTITKPTATNNDLSLAYSPGVAAPCLEIEKNPDASFDYTWRENTVGVISDGTAVLGLGDIGALASLPVMEGKALLLKRFAGVNGIPIILDDVKTESGKPDVQEIIKTIKNISKSFGAINLEDFKAPECFEIEDALQDIGIPVFHDDQHGTAIVVAAGLINAAHLTGKELSGLTVVVNGAGAAGIRIALLLEEIGLNQKNILVVDSLGVIFEGRTENMNPWKEKVVAETSARTLLEAAHGSDVLIGVSKPGLFTSQMIKSMGKDPIIFALANPVPEITPDIAKKAGAKIIATGRGDFPNQVNNVLAFPGVFKGLLEIRAKSAPESIKIAAAYALAKLARDPFTKEAKKVLLAAYPKEAKLFEKPSPLSENYIIPKPLDPRVASVVCEAVKSTLRD